MKRFVIIGGILLCIGTGIWFFFFRATDTKTGNPEVTTGDFFPKPEPGILPDDGTVTGSNGNGGTRTPGTVDGSPSMDSAFTQLTQSPVAGYLAYTRQSAVPSSVPGEQPKQVQEHAIRYVSRTNGYVFEMVNSISPLRISNILIPNIYEAIFTSDGKNVIERFLRADNQTIASYIVPIPEQNPDGTRTQKEGSYLSDNISSLAVSPDGKKAVGVLTSAGNTSITTYTIPSNTADKPTITAKQIYKTAFSEWIISWPVQKAIFMQTKASNASEGFLYNLDNITTKLRRILGNIYGLTAMVSPSGAYVLYSQNGDTNSIGTAIYTTRNGNTTPVGHNILPEKCAWLASENLICAGNSTIGDGSYPDSWYAGVSHFSDQIYYIDTKTGGSQLLYDGSSSAFDMVNLQVDEQLRLLYFIDKGTGNLWRFKYQ